MGRKASPTSPRKLKLSPKIIRFFRPYLSAENPRRRGTTPESVPRETIKPKIFAASVPVP